MAMLEVENIHVYYGSIHAVKGVSFQVNEGEIVTLIGANGAGKSTVLNTVSGLLHPRTGAVRFMDQDLKGAAPHKVVERGLAQVPEGRRIFLQMTVEENLEMGAYTQPGSAVAPGMEDVYKRFPRLEERRRQVAGTLSGGEQQMLAMGRALMSQPKLLMLDEPSMGLAPLLVEQIFDIIRELHAAGTTILLVEQYAQAALPDRERGRSAGQKSGFAAFLSKFSLRSAPRCTPLAYSSTLAPCKVFFPRTCRGKNDQNLFRACGRETPAEGFGDSLRARAVICGAGSLFVCFT